MRALRVLREADLVLAEDTRTSGNLLRHFDIHRPMLSFHKFNEHQVVANIVSRLLGGEQMALVSDAGTPGISDPGYLLVREAVKAGVEVITLPGATAFVPALVSSGLPCDKFCFEGFLSMNRKSRREHLASLEHERRTMIFYEAPHKLRSTLADLLETFGDRELVIARELTKIHEEFIHTTLEKAQALYETVSPKGEFVLILRGDGSEPDRPLSRNERYREKLREKKEREES